MPNFQLNTCICTGGVQSWSTQFCLDLKFPLSWGDGGPWHEKIFRCYLSEVQIKNAKFPTEHLHMYWGGVQSWSTQFCLDLKFPLSWGGEGPWHEKIFRCYLSEVQIKNAKFPTEHLHMYWGGSKLVNSILPRSKIPFILGGWRSMA